MGETGGAMGGSTRAGVGLGVQSRMPQDEPNQLRRGNAYREVPPRVIHNTDPHQNGAMQLRLFQVALIACAVMCMAALVFLGSSFGGMPRFGSFQFVLVPVDGPGGADEVNIVVVAVSPPLAPRGVFRVTAGATMATLADLEAGRRPVAMAPELATEVKQKIGEELDSGRLSSSTAQVLVRVVDEAAHGRPRTRFVLWDVVLFRMRWMLWLGATIGVAFACLLEIRRRAIAKRRRDHCMCTQCGFDLRGAPFERCPECGMGVSGCRPLAR